MFGFRPTLIPTLFTIPALITLLALGTWQVQRLGWKQDLIDALQTRATAPEQPMPTGPLNEEAHEFLNVTLTGVYDHDNEFHLLNRSRNGEPGVNIVTPLLRSDGSAILVNRGWVPFDLRDKATRPQGLVEGEVTVSGLLRFVKPQSWIQEAVVPPNEPANNAWFTIDAAAMTQIAGTPPLPEYFILSGERAPPGGFPVGRQWLLDVRNNHLEYAITWFGLAGALFVIYVLYHRRRPEAEA